MQNGQMTNYIIADSADLPSIRVYFEEFGQRPTAHWRKRNRRTFPMDGPAPAILNAVEDALSISSAPSATPGRYLRRALGNAKLSNRAHLSARQ